MGEGFQFIDIVLFAMIAAFLILRLRSVLGRHRDPGRSKNGFSADQPLPPQEDNSIVVTDRADKPEVHLDDEEPPVPEMEEKSLLDEGFEQIKVATPEFETKEFLQGVHSAFEIIIKSFAKGDREQLESLLSADVYNNFSLAIASREKDNETFENTLIRIVDVAPLEAYMKGKTSHVTVKVVSEQINVTRNAEGEVVDGNPDYVAEISDIWTFARDTQTRDPNWELVATRSLD